MADAPTKDKPPEAPAKRAPDTGMGFWERALNKAKIGIGAVIGDKDAQAAQAFENAKNPGDFILDNLAKDPVFQTLEGKKKIDTIRGDKKLMESLNKAISTDTAVKEGLMSQRGNIGGMTPSQLVDGLQNEDNRRVLTSALNKIAEKPGDEYGLNYLNEIGQAGQKKDLVKLDALLEEGGIPDARVKVGAKMQKSGLGGLEGIMDFFKNPDKAIKDWTNDPNGPLAGLSNENKNMMAGLLKMLAKMFNAFTPGNGFSDPYMKLAGRIGDKLEAEGAKARSQGVEPEMHGMTPSKHAKVGTPGDGNSVQVSENIRPTTNFNSKASGTTGPIAPAQTLAANDPNLRTTETFNVAAEGKQTQITPAQTLAANDPVFRQTGTGGPSGTTLG